MSSVERNKVSKISKAASRRDLGQNIVRCEPIHCRLVYRNTQVGLRNSLGMGTNVRNIRWN